MEEIKENLDGAGNVPATIPEKSDDIMPVSGRALRDDFSPVLDRENCDLSSPELSGADMPTETEEIREYDTTHADESMSGGYASVKGKTVGGDNRLVWIVLIIMTVMCFAVGVCSSLLTARFMRNGDTPPVINTGNDVQQNISAVVSTRKSVIVEVTCGGSTASGIVMKRDGNSIIVMTNAHVIAAYVTLSREPAVRFFGEDNYYNARVVGYDGHYDVAVLSVTHNPVYAVYDLDGSDAIAVESDYLDGDYVVSIGNAMSMGIAAYDGTISRKSELLECNNILGADGKKVVPVMRTTAVINAGMSGCGVFDMKGRLIGLGTYRMSNSVGVDTEGGSSTDVEDTGFATPMSVVYPVYKRILASNGGGAVGLFSVNTQKSASAIGWIGLPMLGINCEYVGGALTVKSVSGDISGVEPGDVVTAIGDIAVTDNICATVGAFLRYHMNGGGRALTLRFERGGSGFDKTFDGYKYAV